MNRLLAVVGVAAVAATVAAWAPSAAAQDTPIGYRVSSQQVVGGRLPDGGAQPLALDNSGYAITSTTFRGCETLITRAITCGTAPSAVPLTRVVGSTSLEVTNSPENPGGPRMKCIADPSDGGVGFGVTNPGLTRLPGESILFALDSAHTVICVCDTPATGLVATECVVGAP